MDILALTTLLTPCLGFLMRLGGEAAESAASEIGTEAWETAKKIWSKLHPALDEKEDAKLAAEQLAAKPDSKARQAVFQEELEILLNQNPALAEAIAQIMQTSTVTPAGFQVNQTVTQNDGAVMGQMTGGSVIGQFRGSVQGGINQ